jgi:hypothetical protein
MAFDTLTELLALNEGKVCKTDVKADAKPVSKDIKPAAKDLLKKKKVVKENSELIHIEVPFNGVEDETETLAHFNVKLIKTSVLHAGHGNTDATLEGTEEDLRKLLAHIWDMSEDEPEIDEVFETAVLANANHHVNDTAAQVRNKEHFITTTPFSATHFNEEHEEEIPVNTVLKVHSKSNGNVVFDCMIDGNDETWTVDIETFVDNTDPI